MNTSIAADGFSAMGSESRLKILRTLVKAGRSGLLVGDIQKRTGIPASTLAHHLKFLSSAKLVLQKKVGRAVVNSANFEHLELLAMFIFDQCCADEVQNSKRSTNRKAKAARA